jgi:hypothetical protein
MSAAVRLGIRERVAGHETAERRRRLGLTRRALATASGVGPARLAAHEGGRLALHPEELGAIDGVLRLREMELGLPSVQPEYVAADTASAQRDEQIRRDVLRILFAGDATRRNVMPRGATSSSAAEAESPPGAQKERPAPHQAPVSSNPSTTAAPLSTGGSRCA